ncbi:hypothetical protein Pint_11986 [Pistacia integerrima]|uniref:Uncharacterized protein n=1 Tax=Pistacia integerrima TaxID=434235 RepID=A0ACC0XIB1_9ROSI|nr:hypothetical protein Pint_11986 [Pistacia integerrima]
MAESFPSTIATNILSKIELLNSKKDKTPSLRIPKEIEHLKETLSNFEVSLLNAEKKQAQKGELQEDLEQLSDQLYDAEDVVDEVECELEKPSNKQSREIPELISKLPNLQTLILLGCSNLQRLPRNMQKMISLRYLEITIKEIGEWMQSFTGLRTLVLQCYDSSNSLPYNIKDLKGLKKLVIRSCPKINLKNDVQGEDPDLSKMRLQSGDSNHWTDTLEYLRIEACQELKELPPWLASLKALKKLEILSCQELSSLPDGMQNLTNLRELKIQNCPTLSKSCRKNLPEISHVLEIQLDSMIASLMN